MLDERHSNLSKAPADQNVYQLGSIAGHNVVIAGMPITGNTAAAVVVAQLQMTFPNVRYGLLVGIGGGVPVVTKKGMIRLGDVVVSEPVDGHSGVIQYDRGKEERDRFVRTGALPPPPRALLTAAHFAGSERASASSSDDPIAKNIARIMTSIPGLQHYRYPGIESDHLYPSSYQHQVEGISCVEGRCDLNKRIPRCQSGPGTSTMIPYINVHRGTIACSEHVLKNGQLRDHWHEEHGVVCFETEAAGALSGDIRYLVIRGISDYCDTHKNDQWQGFAAASAASYARQLFFHMPLGDINR
jgi:nucleoside phosphorylase